MYVPHLEVDPQPFARGGSVAIVVVSLIDAYQACLMLANPMTARATNLTALVLGFGAIHAPGGLYFIAAVMIASAALALVGAIVRLGVIRVLLFCPQLILLGATAYGGQWAALHGHYLDGTAHYPNGLSIPWQHISADQIAWLGLFFVYASAVARRCWEPNF
jgi:hypothetical protein